MHSKKSTNMLITVPNLSAQGGVSAFWNSLFIAFEKFNDIKFKTLEVGGHGKNLLGPLLDQWRLKKALSSEIEIAFINPSLLSKSFFRDGLFAKQLIKKNIPFIVFFHGWDLEFEKKVEKYFIKFFLNSFGKSEKIFTLSPEFQKKIIDWGYKGEVIVETTMVDDSLLKNFFLKDKYEILEKRKTIKILFLARIEREKGIFEMLKAFHELTHKIKDIELIIAGEGKDFEELKKVTLNEKNIQLLGHVEGEEKINLFKECNIYVLPSYSEGLPISVLEAMAFGLPVITTNVGGLKYFFQDQKMGYLTEPKNSNNLEKSIQQLLHDKDKRIKIGEFNFNYAQKNLTSTVVAKRVHQKIKEIQA